MKTKKWSLLACNLYEKYNYVAYIRTLKQALNHGLILKKVHKLIQLNQKTRLKLYIDLNTKLKTESKNDFEKDFFKLMNNAVFGKTMQNVRKQREDFFKLMNNAVFGKTMQNVRKQRDIKLITITKRGNYLVSGPNYHSTK